MLWTCSLTWKHKSEMTQKGLKKMKTPEQQPTV